MVQSLPSQYIYIYRNKSHGPVTTNQQKTPTLPGLIPLLLPCEDPQARAVGASACAAARLTGLLRGAASAGWGGQLGPETCKGPTIWLFNIAMENPRTKWWFIAGKIIYKWAIFHGYVSHNQRVNVHQIMKSKYP